MNTTSLEEASLWMANALGLDPIRDRSETVEYVNKYRNLLYNSFKRVQLFDDYEQCFEITDFRLTCSGDRCETGYRGFTATLDMGGIMGAWESLDPVTVRSRWREVHRGKGSPRGSAVELIPVTGHFATERDMTGAKKLTVFACSESDAGKSVFATVRTIDGNDRRIEFVLGKDNHVASDIVACAVTSITLPVNLCGNVELYQEDGYLLSVYPPGVRTPNYRRYKLHNGFSCRSNTILIQSARVYVPVTEDHDVIEVGDQLVIESAAKYFKYGENSTDEKELKTADRHLSTMFFYLENIVDRDRGRESNDSVVNFSTKPRRSRRRGLTGYRRR